MDFDEIWEEAVDLFDDGYPVASLDAFLFVYSKKIDGKVSTKLSKSASASAILAR